MLKDFKLQLTNSTQHVFTRLVVGIELDGSFLYQLLDSLMEGLLLHDILGRYLHEDFRSKGWQWFKFKLILPNSQRIPDLIGTGIVDPNDVSCYGIGDILTAFCHKLGDIR